MRHLFRNEPGVPATMVVLTIMLLAVLAFGAWLELGDDEQRAQAKLDEHAAWLGGVMQGRMAMRDELQPEVERIVNEAYQVGLTHGRLAGCREWRP